MKTDELHHYPCTYDAPGHYESKYCGIYRTVYIRIDGTFKSIGHICKNCGHFMLNKESNVYKSGLFQEENIDIRIKKEVQT